MGVLKCDFRVVGMVQTNCYFLYDERAGECVVIDPGDDAEVLLAYLREKGLTLKAILLTHGHFDHIGAVNDLREAFSVPVYAAEAEKETLKDPQRNLSVSLGGSGYGIEADYLLSDGQTIELLNQEVRCILTPGHTVGGMCYYFPKEALLFSGDTLFQESVGRTDFPGGSMKEIVRSIREKLFVLPEAVRVFPGHGMMTSIQDEKMYNPFAV